MKKIIFVMFFIFFYAYSNQIDSDSKIGRKINQIETAVDENHKISTINNSTNPDNKNTKLFIICYVNKSSLIKYRICNQLINLENEITIEQMISGCLPHSLLLHVNDKNLNNFEYSFLNNESLKIHFISFKSRASNIDLLYLSDSIYWMPHCIIETDRDCKTISVETRAVITNNSSQHIQNANILFALPNHSDNIKDKNIYKYDRILSIKPKSNLICVLDTESCIPCFSKYSLKINSDILNINNKNITKVAVSKMLKFQSKALSKIANASCFDATICIMMKEYFLNFKGQYKISDIFNDNNFEICIGNTEEISATLEQKDCKKFSTNESEVTYILNIKNNSANKVDALIHLNIENCYLLEATNVEFQNAHNPLCALVLEPNELKNVCLRLRVVNNNLNKTGQ